MTCTVEGCEKPHNAKGYCGMHYMRWRKHGDPQRVDLVVGSGENIGNSAAHWRVRRLRGHASAHPCARCGGLAQDWAYDHADPDERHDEVRGPYSLDPMHYLPMCRICHRRFDLDQQRPDWQTHCGKGHEFTPENTYLRPDDGSRACRACRRDIGARSKEVARHGAV